MFGDKLKKWRKERNLTQSQLGELVGVTGAYIQQLELGKKTNPSLEVVMKLCRELKITPFDLDYDFSENEMYQYLTNESSRKQKEERITYLKELSKGNSKDKRLSDIIEKINSTCELSDEDIKMIDELYLEAYYKPIGKTFINEEGEKTIVVSRNNGDISESDALLCLTRYINYIANSENYVMGSEYSDIIHSAEELIRGKILILKTIRGKQIEK